MELRDFKIGQSFWTYADDEWRCTDVGTRVVVAIKLDDDDADLYIGPPYAVDEIVWDEDDLEVCFQSREAMLADREE